MHKSHTLTLIDSLLHLGECMELLLFPVAMHLKVLSKRKQTNGATYLPETATHRYMLYYHHCLYLQTAAVSTQSAWGSSEATKKTSHNFILFIFLFLWGSDADDDNGNNPNLQSLSCSPSLACRASMTHCRKCVGPGRTKDQALKE